MNTDTLPFGITICGIEELAGHCAIGASHVLSILDPGFPVPEAFGQYGEHERLELRFDDIIDPIPGLLPPGAEDVAEILALGARLAPGDSLIVHCHAGISRSTASMALMLAQAMPDRPAEAILGMVLGIREKAWPNLRIIEMGDRMLGRNGGLVDAAVGLYRLQIERLPHIAEMMEDGGRGRELALARRHPPLKV